MSFQLEVHDDVLHVVIPELVGLKDGESLKAPVRLPHGCTRKGAMLIGLRTAWKLAEHARDHSSEYVFQKQPSMAALLALTGSPDL